MVESESGPPGSSLYEEDASVSLEDVVLTLWPHRWLIVLFTLAGMAAAFSYTWIQPTVYISRANFVVARYNPVSRATGGQLDLKGRYLHAFYEPENQKELIAEIFKSRSFIKSSLDDVYGTQVRNPTELASRIEGNLSVDANVNALREEESPYLRVTYRSTDPDEPVKVLAGLLQAFPGHLAEQIRSSLKTTLQTAERLLEEEDFSRSKRRELQQRIQEIRHALIVERVTGEKFSIQVIDSPGLTASRPSLLTATVLGAGLGLILGLLTALGLEAWDTRIHTSEELEEQTGLQILGEIPQHSTSENGRDPDLRTHDRSPFAEAIRLLRANLKFKQIDSPTDSLLVTSPMQGEGKSTVAYNLAQAYTLEDFDTLLADFDLRRGTVHTKTDMEREPGLTSLLLGEATLQEAVRSAGDLDVLSTGALPPNPSELLSSETVKQVLAEMKKRYDRVILDGTPVLGLADMVEVSQRVDSVLMVFRAENTDARPASDALNDLREVDASIIGAVFNGIPEDGRAYYSGYQYYYSSYDYVGEEQESA